jgi:hypothetical protein
MGSPRRMRTTPGKRTSRLEPIGSGRSRASRAAVTTTSCSSGLCFFEVSAQALCMLIALTFQAQITTPTLNVLKSSKAFEPPSFLLDHNSLPTACHDG